MRTKFGIRNKIRTGFAGLAVLLFFSGVVSFFELRRLTGELLTSNTAGVESTRHMFDILQEMNMLVMLGSADYTLTGPDSTFTTLDARFEEELEKATVTVRDRRELDGIYASYDEYRTTVEQFLETGAYVSPGWLATTYRNSYLKLSSQINDYLVSSLEAAGKMRSHMSETAYRAITPGILALCVGIVILLMFLYLIDMYFARPLVAINRSLRGFLTSRIPFSVKTDAHDEVLELKEQIEHLITQAKAKKIE